jgi:iron complex outermembrane receptor protein
MNSLRLLLLSCGTFAGLVTTLATAAEQANNATLDEVVVTAQRRSEALEEVPMSVTVVEPAQLERGGVGSLETLGRIAAGVQLNYSGAFIQPAIRGITTLTNGNNIENNVAVYIDGAYSPSTISIASDMANVESVQVLKGPQGTLYGRNATGGAILINTRGPSKTFTAKAEVGYGRFKDDMFNFFFAGPVSDKLSYSLALSHRDSPGYFKLVSPTTIGEFVGNVGKQEFKNVTGKLQFDFTDNFTALLTYKYVYNQDDRVNYYTVYDHINTAFAVPPQRATEYGTVAFNGTPFQNAARNESDLKLSWKTGIGTLSSLTSYEVENQASAFDFDASYVPVTFTKIAFKQKTMQESVDYNIDAITHLDLLIGGLYYKDRISSPPDDIRKGVDGYTGTALTSVARSTQGTTSWAVYVDGTYHLADRWSLNLGGRYTHDSKTIEGGTQLFSATTGLQTGSSGAVPPTGQSWTRFTPRASVRYELADKTDVYGSWSRGYRMGNFNTTVIPGIPFGATKPETVDALELGFKTAQANFRFNTAVFYYDYNDINVNISVPSPSPPCAVPNTCGNVSVFSNAPGAKIYGLDAEVEWAPVQNFNIHAGAEWLHARFKTFTNAVGTGVNFNNTLDLPSQIQDWTGHRLARAPDFTANVGVDYTVPTGVGSLMFGVNANYTSEFPVNNVSLYDNCLTATGTNSIPPVCSAALQAPANLVGQQRFVQKPYTLVSAQITLTSPSGHYYTQVWGRNLTDVVYRLNYNGGTFGDYSPRGEPRTYGVKFGLKF